MGYPPKPILLPYKDSLRQNTPGSSLNCSYNDFCKSESIVNLISIPSSLKILARTSFYFPITIQNLLYHNHLFLFNCFSYNFFHPRIFRLHFQLNILLLDDFPNLLLLQTVHNQLNELLLP